MVYQSGDHAQGLTPGWAVSRDGRELRMHVTRREQPTAPTANYPPSPRLPLTTGRLALQPSIILEIHSHNLSYPQLSMSGEAYGAIARHGGVEEGHEQWHSNRQGGLRPIHPPPSHSTSRYILAEKPDNSSPDIRATGSRYRRFFRVQLVQLKPPAFQHSLCSTNHFSCRPSSPSDHFITALASSSRAAHSSRAPLGK